MVPNTATTSDSVEKGDVMTSVDGDGPGTQVIIADISRDEAWLSVPLTEASALGDWR
jgi:hypothetical protein